MRRKGALCGVLISLTVAAAAAEALPHEPFFFVVMADPQLGMTAFGRSAETEIALLEQAVRQVNRLQPAFVVICGDLVHRPGSDSLAASFKQVMDGLDVRIPLFLAAGNHDIHSDPDSGDLTWYRRTFGRDWYSFDWYDVHFVVLNSSLMLNPKQVAAEGREQLRWLESDLESARGATHTIVFQHHSLFLRNVDERPNYFNFPTRKRRRYLQLFRRHGVDAVFSGHYHRPSTGQFERIQVVTTGSVGPARKGADSGFSIVEIYRDRIVSTFSPLYAIVERPLLTDAVVGGDQQSTAETGSAE